MSVLCETLSHKDSAHIILKNGSLRICYHIGRMRLEKIRLQDEPCLTGTGTADDQDVLISRCSRILGPIAHGQPLRCRQDHVILKLGIHEGLDIRVGAP